MSDQEPKKENRQPHKFGKQYDSEIVNLLATHTPSQAAAFFLRDHPELEEYGTREHVLSVIEARFRRDAYQTDSSRYNKIKKKREELDKQSDKVEDFLRPYTYAQARARLSLLHEKLDNRDLTVTEVRGLLSDIRREVSIIRGVNPDPTARTDQGNFSNLPNPEDDALGGEGSEYGILAQSGVKEGKGV